MLELLCLLRGSQRTRKKEEEVSTILW